MLDRVTCLSCRFFFSSRRRHTRWNCDWISDVCSSDLGWNLIIGEGNTRERVDDGDFSEKGREIALTESRGRNGSARAIARAVTGPAIMEKIKGLVMPVIEAGDIDRAAVVYREHVVVFK